MFQTHYLCFSCRVEEEVGERERESEWVWNRQAQARVTSVSTRESMLMRWLRLRSTLFGMCRSESSERISDWWFTNKTKQIGWILHEAAVIHDSTFIHDSSAIGDSGAVTSVTMRNHSWLSIHSRLRRHTWTSSRRAPPIVAARTSQLTTTYYIIHPVSSNETSG